MHMQHDTTAQIMPHFHLIRNDLVPRIAIIRNKPTVIPVARNLYLLRHCDVNSIMAARIHKDQNTHAFRRASYVKTRATSLTPVCILHTGVHWLLFLNPDIFVHFSWIQYTI